MNRQMLSAACVALALGAGPVDAALISFAETGGGVVMSLSGVLTLPGQAPIEPFVAGLREIYVAPATGSLSTDLFMTPQEVLGGDNYRPRVYALSGPRSFGTGGLNRLGTRPPGSTTALAINPLDVTSTSASPVPNFWFAPEFVFFIDYRFVSGSALQGSVTFAGETIASLGLTPGDYDYTLGMLSGDLQSGFQTTFSETPPGFRISIAAPTTAMPLPATAALVLPALGLCALFRRRRRAA